MSISHISVKDFETFFNVSVSIGALICMCPWRPEKDIRTPEATVTGGFRPSDLGVVHVDTQFSQHHLLKMLCFLQCMFLETLSNSRWYNCMHSCLSLLFIPLTYMSALLS